MLWQDLTFAVRLLWKDKWVSLAACTALALGIGANAAVFTFVNAVLLRGLPFHDPEQIVALRTVDGRGRESNVSYADFLDWRAQARSVSPLAATLSSVVNLSDDVTIPEQFDGSYVSASLFPLIGEAALVGRAFTEDDDRVGADPVLLLSYRLWQRRYGGDPAVVGRTIKANSKAYTVAGVMAAGMQFPNDDDLWFPLHQLPADSLDPRRDLRNFTVIGRLASGVALSQAQAEFAAIGARLADAYPATNKDARPRLMSFSERTNGTQIRVMFLSLMGAVLFVLLIACANVANLLLVRASRRAQEIAVRTALGASRGRIVRQLLVESLLMAAISGVAGWGLAVLGVRWFDRATTDVGKPYWMTFDMDATVLAYITVVCLGTAILFGLAPALHASRAGMHELVKDGGRTRSTGLRARRWTAALIVVELVLTLVLLAGAGFMMRSFVTMYRMDVGVDTSPLLTMQLYLPLTRYPVPATRTTVYQQFEDRVALVPGIESSALTSALPMAGGSLRGLAIEGRAADDGTIAPTVTMLTVGDHYFDVLRLPLLRGRAFGPDDGLPGHEAAVVNQRLARQHFGSQDPIGQRIKLSLRQAATAATADAAWATIVGVVPDVRQRDVSAFDPDAIAYLPYRAAPDRGGYLVVRTAEAAGPITASVREAMRVVEPDLPLYNVRTMREVLQRQRWQFEVFGSMFALFAVIALLLATVGLYAVTAYSVSQRTREIGIRMALGARPWAMQWLVLRRSLLHMAIGVPIGLAGALAVGRVLESLLVQMSPSDPLTLTSIVALLLSVGLLAALLPARRAARLDPVIALRTD